jgi:hypothetical protein
MSAILVTFRNRFHGLALALRYRRRAVPFIYCQPWERSYAGNLGRDRCRI